jgi:integrase
MLLEGANIRQSTGIPVGAGTRRKPSREEAEEIYRAAMGDLARGKFQILQAKPTRTFREHAEWYRDHVSKHHRGGRRERSIVNALIAAFEDIRLTQLDTERIEEWKTARAKAGKALATVNRELEVLKPLLRSAVPKYLDRNPADGVARFRTRLPPITILSESAEDALLKVASPAERAMVLLGLDALLRLGDVRRLKVDHDRGDHLVIADPKTEPYKVPVSKRLRAALDVLKPQGGFYFPRRYAGKWAPLGEATAYHLFHALCVRANVPTGRKAGGVTFHSLRHTGATRATRHVKLTVVQRLGGWKSLKQLVRYDHPDDAESIRAVEAIGSRVAHAVSRTRKNRPKKAG